MNPASLFASAGKLTRSTRLCSHTACSRRPRDLGLATQSLHDTAELFATMVDSALQRAERRPVPESVLNSGRIGRVA
jgi:hypothetical protein